MPGKTERKAKGWGNLGQRRLLSQERFASRRKEWLALLGRDSQSNKNYQWCSGLQAMNRLENQSGSEEPRGPGVLRLEASPLRRQSVEEARGKWNRSGHQSCPHGVYRLEGQTGLSSLELDPVIQCVGR